MTDGGIGAGTVNTQRMLESLGRADTIPGITKLRRKEALWNDMPSPPSIDASLDEKIKYIKERKEKEAEVKAKVQEIDNSAVIPVEHPGLKIHVCSLVAPDSEANNWMPVYIHSKLMIINDVFTTHGSANINTRSMQVDSEMNIAHCNAPVTKKMRKRLWNLHTNNLGGQDDPEIAFDYWNDLIKKNQALKDSGSSPKASVVPFMYSKNKLSDLD
ncbi:phospholipase [Enterobacter sp. CFBP8995]|nr:phospholipase [Enterobacter sp. CFBP8995]